jgi:VWFA-related protein
MKSEPLTPRAPLPSGARGSSLDIRMLRRALGHLSEVLAIVGLSVAGLQATAAAAGGAAADDQKVTIDVGVFDAQGQPVRDLAAGDFTVRVKGQPQPRKVVGAEFVSANPEDPAAGAAGAEPRRWIALVLDESSLFAGTEHDMREVAARVLDRLTPADRIAVVALPTKKELKTTFTSDVNEAQQALSALKGSRLPELLHLEMTFGEAIAIGEENDSRIYSTFRNRACNDAQQRDHCLRALNEAAGAAIGSMFSQAKPVFVALAQIIDGMKELPGSKTIVFVSAGTAFSRSWAAVDEIAKRAARGEVTVQSVFIEPREEAHGRHVLANPILDRRVFMERLDLLSHATRGGVFRAEPKDAATVLERVMQETTGWYRLQVESLPGDAADTIPEATIIVARRDLTVRARPLLLRGAPSPTARPTAIDTNAATNAGAAPAPNGSAAGTASLAGTASPPNGNAAAASGANGASATPMAVAGPAGLASLALTLVPPFGRDQVLAPTVLGVFLDQLVARTKKPSAALTAAVARAKNGDLAGAASDSTLAELTKVDPTAASFLRGLSLFATPTTEALEAAATQFRDALRAAPDFYPAAFYLGACYAVGHRDREAAGAWQTALITLSDVPVVYLVLADAWLRLREPAQATDFLDEASQKWPQDVALQKRRVPIALLAGKSAEALATIDRLMSDTGSDSAHADASQLFAGICLLHDAIITKQPIVSADDDRQRLQRYATAYRAANGPQQAEVTRLLTEAGVH